MIVSVRDRRVLQILDDVLPKRFPPDLLQPAQRRLMALVAASQIGDLRIPTSHRLEALSGDRAGQHSIRINRQWRICFHWKADGAHDVEIVDYH